MRAGLDREQAQRRGVAAVVDQPQPALARHRAQGLELRHVGVQHRRGAGRQQGVEEPALGREVGLGGAVVVVVVARQVRERRRLELQPVEPALVEAVARRLEAEPVDALARELGERAVQLDRVGGGERRGRRAALGLDAEGADRGGLAAEPGPELADEARRRGLAAGPRHGRDVPRLRPEEPGGGERQRAARVRGGQHRHRQAGLGQGVRRPGPRRRRGPGRRRRSAGRRPGCRSARRRGRPAGRPANRH